jgi:alanine-glyoxylate transaminase/serine-glyoxylate transaminase/serine-pyruvate transaminase
MTASNMLEKGDAVLVVNTGVFGDWFAECIGVYGGQVTMLKPPSFGDCPSSSDIKQALEKALLSGTPYKMITLTHVDSSSGFVSGCFDPVVF